MSDDNSTPLNEDERARLLRARVEVAPPRAVEEQTVAALRQRGLIRPSRRPLYAVAGLAAAGVLLVAGVAWVMTHRPSPAGTAVSVATGPRYLLLLYAGSEPIGGTAEQRRREYSQWARDIASRGVAISGEELGDETLVVGAGGADGGAQPRGFFIVEAPDMPSAQRLASSCPHLRYGGRIVIRRIAG
jgi:hypothetical protein